MSKALDMPSGYSLDLMLLPNEKMEEFNKFITEYGAAPDRYLYSEISRVKNEVSSEMIQQHIKNLDSLGQMEGLVNDQHRQRIEMVKRILTTETKRSKYAQSQPKAEIFFGGSSLLLWFLILTAIWRRRGIFF